jgi:hypothetical protein
VPGVGAAGDFDLYVLFAMRFKWTPEEVNALEPEFIDELLAYQAAEAWVQEQKAKEAERKRKQAEAGRRR